MWFCTSVLVYLFTSEFVNLCFVYKYLYTYICVYLYTCLLVYNWSCDVVYCVLVLWTVFILFIFLILCCWCCVLLLFVVVICCCCFLYCCCCYCCEKMTEREEKIGNIGGFGINIHHTLNIWLEIQIRQYYTHRKERKLNIFIKYVWLCKTLKPEPSRNVF